MATMKAFKCACTAAFLSSLLFFALTARAQNKVLGELQFQAANKPAKTAGVWVDGQYLGFLRELKGSKKVLLLPGEHEVSVRQAGYKEFQEKVVLEPGQQQSLTVALQKDPHAQYSSVTAEIKISVQPDRAAVFLDDAYAGHAHEFGGVGRAMLVSPGKHHIKIILPGYQDFDAEVNLVANEKYEIKTELLKGSINQADPLIKQPSM
jgi:hypothetical protein